MIPYANARLTAITAPGNAPDYDQPGSAGAARWTGSVGIYVSEDLHEVESPGRIDEIIQTRVEIPHVVGKLVRRGDTLSYTSQETGASSDRVAEDLIFSPIVGRVRVLVVPG